MTITKAHVYTTTDGESFAKHADAKKAQDVIDRTRRLVDLGITDDVAYDIALDGVRILAALTLPSRRKLKVKLPAAS